MGRLARHVGLDHFLHSGYGVVGDVVGRAGLTLVCIGRVQLELGSLVEMSRNETQASLGSHCECRFWRGPPIRSVNVEDAGLWVGAVRVTDRDWRLRTAVRLSSVLPVLVCLLQVDIQCVFGAVGKMFRGQQQLTANRSGSLQITTPAPSLPARIYRPAPAHPTADLSPIKPNSSTSPSMVKSDIAPSLRKTIEVANPAD